MWVMSRILKNKDTFVPLVINHVQALQREAKTRDTQEIVDLTQLVILECSKLIAAMTTREGAFGLLSAIGGHVLNPQTRLPEFVEQAVDAGSYHESNGTMN